MVKIWDVRTGKERHTLRGHRDWVTSLVFSPDGKLLTTGSHDSTIKIWDVAQGTERLTLWGHLSRVSSVAFSPDGRLLASGSHGATIKIWDVDPAHNPELRVK